MARGTARIGIAGWVYAPWRGHFYPEGLVQKNELSYASEQLGIIEINATFRATQKRTSFANWGRQARDGFVFSIKGPQAVTHIKRLKDCKEPLARFFASGPLVLGEKLGPFIWQLPPNMKFDPARLEDFLALLPTSIEEYLELAGMASGDEDAPQIDTSSIGPIRHAMEARHESFDCGAFRELLAQHNVAQVIPDTIQMPRRDVTADFVYCRLQGPARDVAKGYEPADLDNWASQIEEWTSAGKDVFAFFVHEDKLHAPDNAKALIERLVQHQKRGTVWQSRLCKAMPSRVYNDGQAT
ncbi:DUF72 domain-containing protein [Devosia pacifica]|uniref:DUF72 domain-containing protein n=1 Tax=Devosia pacifica TaxID=1335967 RepID=UPI001FCEE429|nr:DUF72 domain-containing protein [Devosia pacifica]